ncbi:hypothetical protein K443DRAFT_11933 [Laccaria amethystina LaAM-08-1]|uniref:Uncharacterized protein n=1 Tax=Laccaria amethystina LaAM-08-1 TaxID=1095629 RepID=A0A0C9WJG2_9AGAR|nr:hypothetical protein K443DRAFT_11933 [Laccaria amethystina LaAM-08-1]
MRHLIEPLGIIHIAFQATACDPRAPGSDGPEDQEDAGVWKRRYLALQENLNTQSAPKSSIRKAETTTSTSQLGRGIRKVVFICGEIKDLVSDSDKHYAYLADPNDEDLNYEFDGLNEDEVEDLKRDWERSHTAVRELIHLIPNFQKKIDEGSPEELNQFYAEATNGARSDDLNRICGCIADWLNKADPTPSPPLDHDCHKHRGLAHDITGRLLCPTEFDWDDLVTRAKLRECDEDFDWLSSYHSRCFYPGYEADVTQLESGYLKSNLLIKVYKSIFTSPSSAKDVSEDNDENMPPAKLQKTLSSNKPVRRNVASKLHLNGKVTPRSIAYAAVQLHFNLQTAGSWSAIYGGFNYQGLYNYVVDVFEDAPGPAAKKRAQDLLNWWSTKIFPTTSLHRRSNTLASRKAFKQQRAALEEEEAP